MARSQPDSIGLDWSVQMFMAWSQPDSIGLIGVDWRIVWCSPTRSLKKRIKIWEWLIYEIIFSGFSFISSFAYIISRNSKINGEKSYIVKAVPCTLYWFICLTEFEKGHYACYLIFSLKHSNKFCNPQFKSSWWMSETINKV